MLISEILSDENFLEINIEKRCRDRVSNYIFPSETLLTQLRPNRKEINKAKLDDIKSIMHLFIPGDAHEFYTHFVGNSIIVEFVNGFNEKLDFDIETNYIV